ncbi:hypothetical protein JTB14_037723 [Gonioctena quinquepunctata]|nr:hypothetical protein JTB14_037723 [Gonioctena quinquepunctata]
MFAIAADGTLLPCYVLYKVKHSYEGWTEGGNEGARYKTSMSRWFDCQLFEDWFKKSFIPHFRKLAGPEVSIGDNLNNYITGNVIQKCENNDLKCVLLPPNSTHLLQLLDVAYFRPLKTSWRITFGKCEPKHRGVIPETEYPRLLEETIEKIGSKSKENSITGFDACGVVLLY